MITNFIENDKIIHSNYGLPFFYYGMNVIIKNVNFIVTRSEYNADLNIQIVYVTTN